MFGVVKIRLAQVVNFRLSFLHIRHVRHAMLSDPGEAVSGLPMRPDRVDFRHVKDVILPGIFNFGAQSLQPFGLRPIGSLSYA